MKEADLRVSLLSRLIPLLGLALASAPLHAQVAEHGQGLAGPYLAARAADQAQDFPAAIEYGSRAIARDPQNTGLLQGLLLAEIGQGQYAQAVPVARQLAGLADDNQFAGLVLLAAAIKDGAWGEVLEMLDRGMSVGGSIDILIRGWALFGKGDNSAAYQTFASLDGTQDPGRFATYHLALARALAGDFPAAAKAFSGAAGNAGRLDRAGVIAFSQILSQLERNPDAVALIDQAFPGGGDGEIRTMRAELIAGKPLDFTAVTSPQQALSAVFTELARALAREMRPSVVLIYARTGEYLDPENFEATLLSATLLEMMQQYELAVQTYARVPEGHRLYRRAALSRAEALRRWDKQEQAVALLEELAALYPAAPNVQKTLGDTYRFMRKCGEAIAPYDRAIALFETPGRQQWSLFFARGICHEQLGHWPRAEADFQKALELNPDQPSVLNYLGYSWVEQRRNLDQALDMIRRAVAARPEDGYITDSLGWVNFRLGNYQDAVRDMERAVELLPVDPVLNDHLGDVYWAVGRRLEARFQWRRALSFITDETDLDEVNPDRIRRKLEVGLDAVLEEEGAEPLIRVDAGSNEGG